MFISEKNRRRIFMITKNIPMQIKANTITATKKNILNITASIC